MPDPLENHLWQRWTNTPIFLKSWTHNTMAARKTWISVRRLTSFHKLTELLNWGNITDVVHSHFEFILAWLPESIMVLRYLDACTCLFSFPLTYINCANCSAWVERIVFLDALTPRHTKNYITIQQTVFLCGAIFYCFCDAFVARLTIGNIRHGFGCLSVDHSHFPTAWLGRHLNCTCQCLANRFQV